MKIITWIARIFVGLLFILSGLIKLNDPVGFSFKLDEYFSEVVFNLPFLQPFALAIALFLVVFEVVLGILLILGYKKKTTLSLLFALTLFFTFLTFYSAYFNKVTDCGCFGDAIALTPWMSFTKDLVLLILISILIAGQKHLLPIFKKQNKTIVVLSFLFCVGLGYYVLTQLPVIDFRAYKVGTNIPEGMKIPEGALKSEIEILFKYKVQGEEKTFTMNQLSNLPKDAQYISREEKIIRQGYKPPIHDFTIERDGANYADTFLAEKKVLVFVAYNLSLADDRGLSKLNELTQRAKAKGYHVIGLTASALDVIEAKNNEFKFLFDFYFCDATTLKTIERANPSIVVLEYGTITQKVHWRTINKLKL